MSDIPQAHHATPARALVAAILCLASCVAPAQTNDLASDARFKASIDAVRQQLLPARHSANAPRGEPTLGALLARLERVENIDQLCQQGLGSQHLCSTRIAQIDAGLGASIGNPLLHALDLSPLHKGLGASVSAALRQPQNLSQAKTKANLTLTDLRPYTGQAGPSKPNPRWSLRGLLGQLPAMAVSGELRGFKSADQASMAGELLADFGDHLMDTLGEPLERCAPEDLTTLGDDESWYATPKAVEASSCLGRLLSARETSALLHKTGLILQLPEQWMAQGLFFADSQAFFAPLASLGRALQVAQITLQAGRKPGTTFLQLALPFSVDGITCDGGNNYCTHPKGRLDDGARCILSSHVLDGRDCSQVADTLLNTAYTANWLYQAWPQTIDFLRALQGKPPQSKDTQAYMAMANTVSEDFARIAQEPQSSLVIKIRQISPPGTGREAAAWVVDAFSLRQ